jgi:hypothetical protein
MDRIAALLVDGDVSLSVTCITDDTLGLDRPTEPPDAPPDAPPNAPPNTPPNSQSVVLSLDQDATEANLILKEITG